MRESLHIESTITDARKTSRYPAMRDDSGARNMSRTQMCVTQLLREKLSTRGIFIDLQD